MCVRRRKKFAAHRVHPRPATCRTTAGRAARRIDRHNLDRGAHHVALIHAGRARHRFHHNLRARAPDSRSAARRSPIRSPFAAASSGRNSERRSGTANWDARSIRLLSQYRFRNRGDLIEFRIGRVDDGQLVASDCSPNNFSFRRWPVACGSRPRRDR